MTLAKCLQNLLRDSTWSVISIAKKFLFKVVSMILKMPIVTFFLTTLYLFFLFLFWIFYIYWATWKNRFFNNRLGGIKLLFRATWKAHLNDPRSLEQEEQQTWHPPAWYWPENCAKNNIFQPETISSEISSENILRNQCYT